MTKVSPKKIKGKWHDGYALDFHTVSSDFIGYNEYGHPQFDTKYTDIGNLLYRLKSQKDRSVIEEIVKTAAAFVQSKSWTIDLVVPVPASNARSFQPVVVLAERLAKSLKVKCCNNCVIKIKDTTQIKNVFEAEERRKMLTDAFQADSLKIRGKSVLLLDDLYRSGATMNEVSSSLLKPGKASLVYALTLTKTRVKR